MYELLTTFFCTRNESYLFWVWKPPKPITNKQDNTYPKFVCHFFVKTCGEQFTYLACVIGIPYIFDSISPDWKVLTNFESTIVCEYGNTGCGVSKGGIQN